MPTPSGHPGDLLLLALMTWWPSSTKLMPVFAKTTLKGGPPTLGFLLAASWLGAQAGAILRAFALASWGVRMDRRSRRPFGSPSSPSPLPPSSAFPV
jgi:hypothetical protein